MFLDFAEDQAERRKQVFLKDWKERLDGFLRFNERRILDNPGKVSRAQADQLALGEFTEFEKRRRERVEMEAESQLMKQLEGKTKRTPKND